MLRIAIFARVLTIILFLGVLLFVYAYLPEQVGVSADEYDKPNAFIGRELFFYSFLVVFSLVNLIFVLAGKLLGSLAVGEKSFFASKGFKDRMTTWLIGLGVVINIFIIITVAFLGLFNNADYYHISQFSMLAYLGQAIIFIWIVLFFYLLIKRK